MNIRKVVFYALVALFGYSIPCFSTVTATSATLTWTLATDPDNAQNTLRYEVCQASANTIGTVAGCEAATIVQVFTVNIATATITGLTPSTAYWFNVVVEDPAGNKAPYVPLMVTTLPDTSPPVPGNGGTIIAANISGGGVQLSWTSAVDSNTPQNALLYEVCQARSNSVKTIDGCESSLVHSALGITSFIATGLRTGTRYHFNVVVSDQFNKAAYIPVAIIASGL